MMLSLEVIKHNLKQMTQNCNFKTLLVVLGISREAETTIRS